MQMLIVGIGALGGTIAARALRAGLPVRLAARNTESAEVLRRSGLRVSGIGGEVRADVIDIAAVEDYGKGDQFDLILLATKAQDTLEVAPRVLRLLAPGGVMLPIQNGGVARVLADVSAKTGSLEESQILVPRWWNPVSTSRRMPGI
jgi:2-dehydropantoate 2-reductase